MITVEFIDRPTETYNTISYNCQGGFFMIIQSGPGNRMTTTCIPSEVIKKVTVNQNM